MARGITPEIQPRAAVSFSYLTRIRSAQPALRATALGGYSRSGTSRGDLHVAVTALQLEACAWGWSDGATGLEPCAGLELGLVSAKNEGPRGLSDSAPWATGFVRGRAYHLFGAHWGIEAHVGAFMPWFRYEYAGTEGQYPAYRVKAVGLGGALGALFALE
ncbi:hypothetical protein ACFL5O_07400 [Myxococcota bacterium]